MTITRKTVHTACALLAALLIVSCGSDDDDTSATGDENAGTLTDNGGNQGVPDTASIGVIFANEQKSVDNEFFMTVSGFFLEASTDVQSEFTDTEFPLDVCEIDQDSNSSLNLATDSVSAGETVIISNTAGTLATLERTIDDLGIRYGIAEESLQPFATGPLSFGLGVPAGDSNNLTIDVPGDTFPAFSSIVVSRAVQMELIAADMAVAGMPTAFSWVAGEDVQTGTLINYVDISLYGESLRATCRVVDDGSFEIPQSFLTTLSDFNFEFGEIERERSEVFVQQDGILGFFSSSNPVEF